MNRINQQPQLAVNLLIVVATIAGTMAAASARSMGESDKVFTELKASLQVCLEKASRPGFPYYDRPEAAEACNQTKARLEEIGRAANRARNLACSSRINGLAFDLWMVQFLGSQRMGTTVSDNIEQLKRNCYHIE
ncbi:MAG: hypothetical protein ACKOCM_08970 [Cyanobacteriota bacterium]